MAFLPRAAGLGPRRGAQRDPEYRLHRRRRQRGERHRQAGRHGRIWPCATSTRTAGRHGREFKEAKKYVDYRELLHELDSKIDAVVVSTPDHTHAPAAVTAMRLGKHVYCQKPLAHSVWECRLMRETARQKGVCTQMGNQGTADPGFRRGAELVRPGAIGEVREVHIWTNRPFKYWKQAPDIVARPAKSRCRSTYTGTCSWERPPSVPTTRSTIPTTGAAGGTSAPARWATWPATRRT